MSSSEEDLPGFIAVLGLAVFVGLCTVIVILIATSSIILVVYAIIDCLLRPFLGRSLDLDLEFGERGSQRARIVTYHAIFPTDLLRLQDSEREGSKRGLKQSVIETLLPKLLVGQDNEDDEEKFLESKECPICLNGYVVNEECRVFPVCRHMYHALCIDAWLKNHLTCPTCRKGLPDL